MLNVCKLMSYLKLDLTESSFDAGNTQFIGYVHN